MWRETKLQPLDQYGDYAAITNVLNGYGLPPDFEADGPIRFTHRSDGDVEIYFLANRESRTVETSCLFRVAGKQPELWNPMTGETRVLPQFTFSGGRTTIPMRFEPLESCFVVFRKPAATVATQEKNFPNLCDADIPLAGAWAVSFDSKWGGPEKIRFDSLDDWSQRPEAGIKYYSGKAVYRKSFAMPDGTFTAGKKYFLDLGVVKNLARVRLNGRDLGVAWCFPWRVDVSSAIKTGNNDLEIEVANLWPNRLIGDLSLSPEKRFASTTHNPYKQDSPLLPSGLLGPVTILMTSNDQK